MAANSLPSESKANPSGVDRPVANSLPSPDGVNLNIVPDATSDANTFPATSTAPTAALMLGKISTRTLVRLTEPHGTL
jgi:hypothetical protein